GPAQPALLHDVLGVRRGAEHLVRDREQQVAVLREHGRRIRHAGSAHRSEKPWLVRPSALLKRDRSFSIATIIVSSTTAGTPSTLLSRATISSVTVGGVAVIASAYSITSFSPVLNASDSR